MLITSLVDYRYLKWAALPLYLAGIAGVILTYTGLGEEHGGAKCWLRIPGVGTFQPSQLVVLAAVLVLGAVPQSVQAAVAVAEAPTRRGDHHRPDGANPQATGLGMTLVFVPVVMALLFLSGIPKRFVIVIVLFGIAAMPVAMNFVLKPYQRARLVSFIDPDIDPKGTSWAINQSLIAIGSGGFGGKGFKAANTQVEQGFLPGTTVHTDYIFSAIGEQWGFVGGVALISVFGVLLLSMLFTAYHAADEFGLLVTVGFSAQIFFHVYQNIGMTVALMPITGLPLPLISYGGTFLVLNMFGIGLVNSVWVHRKDLL